MRIKNLRYEVLSSAISKGVIPETGKTTQFLARLNSQVEFVTIVPNYVEHLSANNLHITGECTINGKDYYNFVLKLEINLDAAEEEPIGNLTVKMISEA